MTPSEFDGVKVGDRVMYRTYPYSRWFQGRVTVKATAGATIQTSAGYLKQVPFKHLSFRTARVPKRNIDHAWQWDIEIQKLVCGRCGGYFSPTANKVKCD